MAVKKIIWLGPKKEVTWLKDTNHGVDSTKLGNQLEPNKGEQIVGPRPQMDVSCPGYYILWI